MKNYAACFLLSCFFVSPSVGYACPACDAMIGQTISAPASPVDTYDQGRNHGQAAVYVNTRHGHHASRHGHAPVQAPAYMQGSCGQGACGQPGCGGCGHVGYGHVGYGAAPAYAHAGYGVGHGHGHPGYGHLGPGFRHFRTKICRLVHTDTGTTVANCFYIYYSVPADRPDVILRQSQGRMAPTGAYGLGLPAPGAPRMLPPPGAPVPFSQVGPAGSKSTFTSTRR